MLRDGTIKSSIGLGILLWEGIGDTIRVSLADDPIEEVPVCWGILKSLGLREKGFEITACPSCGRAEISVLELGRAVEAIAKSYSAPVKVAVMGCVVNGPGESKMADVGVAGGKGKGAIYRAGELVGTYPESELLGMLRLEIEKVIAEKYPAYLGDITRSGRLIRRSAELYAALRLARPLCLIAVAALFDFRPARVLAADRDAGRRRTRR